MRMRVPAFTPVSSPFFTASRPATSTASIPRAVWRGLIGTALGEGGGVEHTQVRVRTHGDNALTRKAKGLCRGLGQLVNALLQRQHTLFPDEVLQQAGTAAVDPWMGHPLGGVGGVRDQAAEGTAEDSGDVFLRGHEVDHSHLAVLADQQVAADVQRGFVRNFLKPSLL